VSKWPVTAVPQKAYQIIESKKKAPIIEIIEPKEDSVFHFRKLSG